MVHVPERFKNGIETKAYKEWERRREEHEKNNKSDLEYLWISHSTCCECGKGFMAGQTFIGHFDGENVVMKHMVCNDGEQI